MPPILPKSFLTQMRAQLGDENDLFLASFSDPAWRGIRLNTIKNVDANIFNRLQSVISCPNPHCPNAFAFRAEHKLGQTLAYLAGLFYIQEPSAMVPAFLLGALPGERVLDLCAAPGGKSTQIATSLQGRGLLIANDASPTRAQALVRNIERAGVRNAIITMEQPHKLAARFGEFFDRVLVDAPCSGEGMFRRDAEVLKAYTANKPEVCAAIQSDILRNAALMVRRGGRLVYSTCTFNTVENEGIVEAFIKKHHDFSVKEMKRIWPHRDIGEGHFVAVLERGGGQGQGNNTVGVLPPPPRKPLKRLDPNFIFGEFCEKTLYNTTSGYQVLHKNNLYIQPEAIDLQGLRIARSGWHVGEISKERFVPSQALAMALRKEDARFAVDLPEADAWRYIRGESLDFPMHVTAPATQKPWVLITYENHPLGWARLVQGRLKNQLPVGWVR
ncbi:MAG: RsmF rRNA methyltransferase first C-terminal domain-containing protein [Defluviitaleaceae bacterium]|nr:RsmF rRNA methyltransferase first C-terminal domain-containing protein [Defluviitaleaceae bacterium]MCL2274672.1 RsmF rRNA methyltransferase first C-terminal domain-containing protein [Defluviitaleaceae bacterium]MCL2275767.1 RsmF rRNA methyltransferase first C-terminal domain-containing protein [Defluviitaleaceae bacterium]